MQEDKYIPPMEENGDNVESKISERLGGAKQSAEANQSAVVKESTTLPFDINSLNREQLMALKSRLNATPDAPKTKKGNIVIKLRKLDDKIIVDFSKSYSKLVRDHENMREVYALKIKVWFLGESEPQEVGYADFMQAEQVKFEVIRERKERDEVIEGRTVSAETGEEVDMVCVYEYRFFTIVINGQEIEISDKVSNA